VVLVDRGDATSVGALFALWGQAISSRRLAGFAGPVSGFVDGRRWRGPVGAIPLRRHSNVVLEVDGYVPPHPAYRFPPGT
jgi:hypothetical protein